MLQELWRKVVASSRQLKNFFVVVEVRSVSDFLKIVRKEKNPQIHISVYFSDRDRRNREAIPCCANFTSFLEDGRTVVLKLQEELRIFGRTTRDSKRMKQYINLQLLHKSVKPPVQVFFALMPNVVVEVRDLYGKLVNPNEFKIKEELF